MPVRRLSNPQAEVGPIALRLLTVPVMLSALLVAYLLLRWAAVDGQRPPQVVGAVEPAALAPAIADVESRAPVMPAAPVAHDPATHAPGRLDAAGAGLPAPAP